MKNIALLGSTGSIGKSTLDVVRNNGADLNIVALTAGKNWRLLAEQAREFKPSFVAIADKSCEKDLRDALADTGIKVGAGDEAIVEAVTINDVDNPMLKTLSKAINSEEVEKFHLVLFYRIWTFRFWSV